VTLAILSAILYILAFPSFNQAWLAWIALVPIAIVARRSTPKHAFLWGWLAGTLAYSGILYWIIVTFQAAHLSIFLACLCLLLLSGYLGLFWGLWACLLQKYQALLDGRGAQEYLALLGAAMWVALEYLRTYLFSGFPWTLLADSQVKFLPIIQIASITGVYGVSFLVVLVNLALAAVFSSCHPRMPLSGIHRSVEENDGFPLTTAGMTASTIIICYLFGLSRLHHPQNASQGQPLKVALLQGNIDQYKKWDKAYVEEIERTYEGLINEASTTKPDIILWPETSVPGYLLQDPPLRDWLQRVVKNSRSSHLVGAPVMHDNNAYNSAFSLNTEGDLLGEYAKKHLVPFGETVPWGSVLGRFISVLNDLGGFTAGQNSPVLPVAGTTAGVNICYEAIFPNLVRQSIKQGAELIVNLTNDGWYMRTAAPYQHWAPNIFRAVENGRWLLRADNTGISGIIDPYGRIAAASSIFEPMVVKGTAIPLKEMTFYTRVGDAFAWICCLMSLGALFLWI
jgi:apolipoprotein N-acyltransferase